MQKELNITAGIQMALTKQEKIKRQSWIRDTAAWEVSNYGVSLLVNVPKFTFGYGISLDVEDDEKGGFVGIGIYDPSSKSCFYFSDWELAKQLTIPRFVAHNGISDVNKLKNWGFKIDESWLIWDTQIYEHLLDSTKKTYGLKDICKRRGFREYPTYEELTGKKDTKEHLTLDKLDPDLVANYNACDTYFCYQLYLKQNEQIQISQKS